MKPVSARQMKHLYYSIDERHTGQATVFLRITPIGGYPLRRRLRYGLR